MLFENWTNIVARHGKCVALWQVENQRSITFEELDARADECVQDGSLWVAHGNSPDFFPTLIAAWKHKRAVILSEGEQQSVQPIRGEIPEGTALIKQTCGASGVERSLFFTEEQIFAEARRNIDGLGLHPERPGLAAISLAHSYGFGCLALPLLLHGVPLHLVPAPLPMFLQKVFEKEERLFLPGVPAIWKTWWKTGVTAHPAIDLALSAGAPLSQELEQGVFSETGLKIHNFYGTSETGAISYDATDEPRAVAGEVGHLLPGVSVSTDDAGHLIVRSDSQAEGTDLLLCGDEFSTDHYRTTDLGQLEEGVVILSGSTAGAINVAGRKVSPDKIQRELLALPGVLQVEVGKTPSRDFERFEEIQVKVIVSEEIEKRTLRNQLRTRLETWEMPRHWEVTISGEDETFAQ